MLLCSKESPLWRRRGGAQEGFLFWRVFNFERGLCKALPFAGLKIFCSQRILHNKPSMARAGSKTEISGPLPPGIRYDISLRSKESLYGVKEWLCVVRNPLCDGTEAGPRRVFFWRVFYFERGLCKALPFAGLKTFCSQKILHNKPSMARAGSKTENSGPLPPGIRYGISFRSKEFLCVVRNPFME